MHRQRVLLLENDGALVSLLCALFADEALDVTLCDSLTELENGVKRYPRAAVVSDSWSSGDNHTLSSPHRAEIIALASTAEVVLITARQWALSIRRGELGSAVIVEKPFDLDHLMIAVRAALARAARGADVLVAAAA
jgi:DNA-binding NtrC family response regulator